MLVQGHAVFIGVFPDLPVTWQNASFRNLRAMGAFLVSATYRNGETESIHITSEKGGLLKVFNPFTRKVVEKEMEAGEIFSLTR